MTATCAESLDSAVASYSETRQCRRHRPRYGFRVARSETKRRPHERHQTDKPRRLFTATLEDVLAFLEDPKTCTLEYDGHAVTFQDEAGLSASGNESWFIAGFEFGPQVLIHSRSYGDAWEAWVDESKTIPEEELPEAYGIDETPEMAAWKESHPAPQYGGAGSAWDEWVKAKNAEAMRILQQWDEDARARTREDYPELVEGYEMQSNCTGTGIVDMGHYAWMNKADLAW